MADQPIPRQVELVLKVAPIGVAIAAYFKGAPAMDSSFWGLVVSACILWGIYGFVRYLNAEHQKKEKVKQLAALALFAEDQALATREPPEKALADIRTHLENVLGVTLPASQAGWELHAAPQPPSLADPRTNSGSHLGGPPQ